MKKLAIAALALALCGSLAACGEDKKFYVLSTAEVNNADNANLHYARENNLDPKKCRSNDSDKDGYVTCENMTKGANPAKADAICPYSAPGGNCTSAPVKN